jgi:hypothetical protein
MTAFEKGTLNRVRVATRASYDQDTVFSILDQGLAAHVGFTDHDRPVVIPMIYGRIGERLYLHGAKAARFAKVLGGGVPICVTVTLIDGIVAGRSAFHSSMNYRSVVLHGTAALVTDPGEREAAMEAVTNHLMPGRWDEVRPTTAKELAATAIISFAIEEASAKARTGPPNDDKEDYDLPIWGGVVPLQTVYGAPEDDGALAPGTELPDSIRKILSG